MRVTAILCAIALVWAVQVPQAAGEEDPLTLSADAAAVIDVESGRLLYEKDAYKQMRIASLTKIMTAIVAIENSDLQEKVKVGPQAVGVEGSSIYLKQGEEIPLESLLYGLMLRSGNDAAVAIAEHVGGSLEGFVLMMNEKAEYLGLEQTHFENPHGLDAPEHYSSAADVARLTAYALHNPDFKKIVSTPVKTVPWPGEEWHRKWYNKNKMLRLYPGADGVKTGYTKMSKRTLVSSATRKGRQLVSVTLAAPDDWNDSMHLLEYGFTQFERVSLLNKGDEVTDISGSGDPGWSAAAEDGFAYPLKEEERNRIRVEPLLTLPASAISGEGVRVGTARIYVDEKQVGSVPLISRLKQEKTGSLFHSWLQVVSHMMGREW
ncbi:D-alanyl-D-alanine carboxypeptidase family protein [Desmospora profundinema]|uniref:serine-type D-Ala-D-Ala carboxypeptidase n=1 Tax=Desmospora profundinema TaxID=1571184 RepID=A0ABU1IIE5_9BACL|nr:D-alanyl-D-alanine carboxypeptidase family protein [Desmospora profundinema]MDR6224551.1 D-alanyl-D-alanine carboxypeptidase [Desmospora profundinema]